MANTRFAQEYRKNSVNGASPLQLIIMLYDGALRFMEGGRQAILQQDLSRQNDQLQRAQKIIMELMACLDMDKGGDVSKNLLALYTYVLNELVRANLEDDPEGVQRCVQIISELRESWDAIDRSTRQGTPAKEQAYAA